MEIRGSRHTKSVSYRLYKWVTDTNCSISRRTRRNHVERTYVVVFQHILKCTTHRTQILVQCLQVEAYRNEVMPRCDTPCSIHATGCWFTRVRITSDYLRSLRVYVVNYMICGFIGRPPSLSSTCYPDRVDACRNRVFQGSATQAAHHRVTSISTFSTCRGGETFLTVSISTFSMYWDASITSPCRICLFPTQNIYFVLIVLIYIQLSTFL